MIEDFQSSIVNSKYSIQKDMLSKILKLQDLIKVVHDMRKLGKKIVFTNGCLIFCMWVMCVILPLPGWKGIF